MFNLHTLQGCGHFNTDCQMLHLLTFTVPGRIVVGMTVLILIRDSGELVIKLLNKVGTYLNITYFLHC